MTPASIADEIRAARADFHHLVDEATTAELRKRSNGTRWTNDQLLFHMLFGYLIVRALLWLVRGFSMLPVALLAPLRPGLNAATRPFHVINYLGSLGGARVLGHSRMEQRHGPRRPRASSAPSTTPTRSRLARGMHFPVGWDPYFRDYMTVQDVLHYATQHYEHHRRNSPSVTPAATDHSSSRLACAADSRRALPSRRCGRQSWADSSPAAPTRAHSAHGPIAYTAPPMSGPAPVPIVYATPYNPW